MTLGHRSVVVTAQAVKGKRGFVYSPHTSEPKQIDVRDFQAGARVRCPYTKKSFIVPGAAPEVIVPQPRRTAPTQMIAQNKPSTTRSAKPRPAPRKTRTPSPTIAKKQPDLPNKIEADSIKLDPEPISGILKETGSLPTESEALALPTRPEQSAPVGKRVAGKPNYVHSPFAASNQVVDVEGHPAGTKVKCPYTDKVFTVPPAAPDSGAE